MLLLGITIMFPSIIIFFNDDSHYGTILNKKVTN